MKIGICGCGISGLACGALLAEKHDVTIFDQFDKPAPVGSGLIIQPAGQMVLEEIGILDDTIADGQKIFHMDGIEIKHGHKVLNVSYGPRNGRNFGISIHRNSLFQNLLKAALVSGVKIKAAHRVTASTLRAEQRYLEFDTETDAGPFDLVIDSSGANSPLSPIKTNSLPFGALWANVNWVDGTLMADQLNQRYRKATNMVGVMNLGRSTKQPRNQAAVFWSMPKSDLKTWKDNDLQHWKDEVLAIWPEILPFVEQIRSHDDLTFAQYRHGRMRKPYDDRIAYIGDCAHQTSPQLGQGANMGLLDALALHRAIEYDPSNALATYAQARKLHVGIYHLMSGIFTPMYQSDSTILPFVRDWLLTPLSQIPPSPTILTRLVNGTLSAPLGKLTKTS